MKVKIIIIYIYSISLQPEKLQHKTFYTLVLYLQLISPRKSWYYTPDGSTNQQVAGYYKSYKDLTFVTIKVCINRKRNQICFFFKQ